MSPSYNPELKDKINEYANVTAANGEDSDKTKFALPGSSGSLLVNQNNEVVAILYATLVGRAGYAQILYSSDVDVIGSNMDGSNPSENINPTTFGHALREAIKFDPAKYELLDMFKDKKP